MKINQYNKNAKRDGHWINFDESHYLTTGHKLGFICIYKDGFEVGYEEVHTRVESGNQHSDFYKIYHIR